MPASGSVSPIPAAAESVRQQMLAQHDQSSKRMLQAMLDVSKVLTPAQRAKLGARLKQRQAIMQKLFTPSKKLFCRGA